MKHGTVFVLALVVAGCASSRSRQDEPTTIQAPEPKGTTAPSVEARLTELQTSMTELLERLDVLNSRIAKLESSGGQPSGGQPPPAVQPGQARAPVLHFADIAEAYRHGLMLFAQKKYAEARAAFQRVFDADPTGDLADNALFWIGETYFAAGDYSNAVRYYQRVVKEYADQNKAPDALFKMGMTFEKTGDLGMARRTFEECIRKYPYSTPAAAAKQELKRIKY
jgi:tol-pal system protein YbgF